MKKLKRILAIILATVMVFSFGSITAFAEGEATSTIESIVSQVTVLWDLLSELVDIGGEAQKILVGSTSETPAGKIILEKTVKVNSTYTTPTNQTFTFWIQALPIDTIVGNQFTVTDLGKSNYSTEEGTGNLIENIFEEITGWTKYIPRITTIQFNKDDVRDANNEITYTKDITQYFEDEFSWILPGHENEDRVEAWAVFEVPPMDSHISCDLKVYIVVKYSIKALGIENGLVIFSGTDLQAGEKSGKLRFKNYYGNEALLTITNSVYKETENGARFPLTDVSFKYELCIEEPEEAVQENYHYTKYKADGTKESTKMALYGDKVKFTLKHGEYVKLDTPQPAGTKYYVMEFGKTGYLPSVEWYDLDGLFRFNTQAKVGSQGVTLVVDEDALGLIKLQRIGAPESEVDFCNVITENTPPTGVIMKIWPFALIVLVVAGGLTLIVVLRRKKRTY